MCGKALHRFFYILFVLVTIGGLTAGCTSTKLKYKPKKEQYRTTSYRVKIKTTNDIQYKSAYKYDSDGKKYKKHFRQKRRREN
jgi:hypothetical protein